MGVFKNWLDVHEMAVKTVKQFGKQIPNLPERDSAGMKHMARPGYRQQDRFYLDRECPEAARKLTAATEKYGIHWILAYLEPPEDMKEDDPDDWARYAAMTKQKGAEMLQQFGQEYQQEEGMLAPPNPENTIVYIKPGSRIHCLTAHEQIHNIGHALWLRNPRQMVRAKQELQQAVRILQQSAHEADPNSPPPTEAEITIMLGRLVNLLSYQRALTLNPGDLSSSVKTALTAFQNFDEVIFELIPAFVNAGGQVNLYPRGPGKIAKFDREQAIPPNQEVIQQRGVRPWVWEKMAADRNAWAAVSKIITGIIIECLHASTWAVKGGPIYPYQKLTTKP
jgi:hypothetical protein